MKPERNLVEWRLVPFDSGTVRSKRGALTPFVDGESLTALVREFERQRGFEPAGNYAGLMEPLDPAEWRALLFGRRPENFWHVAGSGVPLLGCGCSDLGCWPLLARIVRDNNIVRWEHFEQPHRRQRDYNDFGPFVFDATSYQDAVEHAVSLESSRG